MTVTHPMPTKKKLTLKELAMLNIAHGSHQDRSNGLCVMEAVAWIAGEKHSDKPECISPLIAGFLRSWNDALPSDDDRNRLLKPLVKLTIGTVASQEVEERRAFMCMDWIVRTFTPAWFDLSPTLKVHAEALRRLPKVTSWDGLIAATPVLVDAQKSAAAAGAAAWAAWAAWAALTAAGAARAAAWAAGAAARYVLKRTMLSLQDSAADLVKRMCLLGRGA